MPDLDNVCVFIMHNHICMQGQAANCTINVLRAHAAAVEEFRRIVPGGKISMNLNLDHFIPFHENDELDKASTSLSIDNCNSLTVL